MLLESHPFPLRRKRFHAVKEEAKKMSHAGSGCVCKQRGFIAPPGGLPFTTAVKCAGGLYYSLSTIPRWGFFELSEGGARAFDSESSLAVRSSRLSSCSTRFCCLNPPSPILPIRGQPIHHPPAPSPTTT